MSPTGFAPVHGAQLYYEITGDGFPVVFTHAGVADHRQWNTQVAAFAPHYRVVRYDMRGFGKSEPVDGEYALHEDLLGLMDYLQLPRAHLVGCSMGGGASMNAALLAPERVASLTMVGSGPDGLDLDVPESPLFREAEAAWKAKDWDQLSEIEVRIWFDGVGRTPADMHPATRALVYEMVRIGNGHAAKGLGRRKPGLVPPAAERLDALTPPLLMIYGDRDDPYIVAAVAHVARRIPSAQQALMPGTAHLPNMERPDEFNRILLAFLRDKA